MRCCFLSKEEAIRFERDGTLPSCKDHVHKSFMLAQEKVDLDEWRWVTCAGDSSHRRVTQATQIKYWTTRPSVIRSGKHVIGAVSVMQAVGQ